MNILGRIHHWATVPRSPSTREYSHTLFLKFLSSQRVGGFVLGHYLTNPDERPDHVFQHDYRCRPRTRDDFVTIRRAVLRISAEDDERLERSAGEPPKEHLMALMDESGNVMTLDYLTEADAQRVMDLAGAGAAVRSDKRDEWGSIMQKKNFPGEARDPVIFGGLRTYLRTIAAHQVRGLTFGHYESNPSAAPDHVLMRAEVPRAADGTSLQVDYHSLVPVGPSIMAEWPGPDPTFPCRNLLIVSGTLVGWVILCDAFSESFADALFHIVDVSLEGNLFAD